MAKSVYTVGTVTNNKTGQVRIFLTSNFLQFQRTFVNNHHNHTELDNLLKRYNDPVYWNWRIAAKGDKKAVTMLYNQMLDEADESKTLNIKPSRIIVKAGGRCFSSIEEAAAALGYSSTTINYRIFNEHEGYERLVKKG